ncbi:peptidoglycan-binding domain-containing protein [Streptomyces hawaiiensis]|uniref:peptidoglycan-binding domain-containing protein n=1 Tax=Streptomyces hawaiiensis TaxID=67305 RepID=UPI003649D277
MAGTLSLATSVVAVHYYGHCHKAVKIGYSTTSLQLIKIPGMVYQGCDSSTGDGVKALQHTLISSFGPATQTALAQAQREAGITADGAYDIQTPRQPAVAPVTARTAAATGARRSSTEHGAGRGPALLSAGGDSRVRPE